MKSFFTLLFLLVFCGLYSQTCTINAGVDHSICGSTSDSLLGNYSGQLIGKINWVCTNDTSVKISNSTSLKTKVNGLQIGHSYIFTMIAVCSDSVTVSDQVTIKVPSLPTKPDAGIDTQICMQKNSVFKLNANSPNSGENAYWSPLKINTVIFGDSSSPHSKVVNKVSICSGSLVAGLVWNISNNNCVLTDTVFVEFLSADSVDAGPHQEITCGTGVTLKGSCAGSLKSNGLWTIESGPGGAKLVNENQSNASLINISVGTYILKWTVSNKCMYGSDTVSITVNSIVPPNKIGTSSRLGFCYDNLPDTFNLIGIKPDSGQSGTWAQTAGISGTIDNTNNYSTFVTGITSAGSYNFRYTLKLGKCKSESNIQIIVSKDTLINGGTDTVLACDYTCYNFKPITTGGQYSFFSGPAVPTISGNQVTGMNKPGEYLFSYKYSNYCGSYYDTLKIVISRTPDNSNAGTDLIFPCGVSDGYLAANYPTLGIGSWSQVSGPSKAVFQDIYNPSTKVSGLKEGQYKFKWSITGGINSVSSFDEVSVYISSSKPTQAHCDSIINTPFNSPVSINGNSVRKFEIGFWKIISGQNIYISDSLNKNTYVYNTQPSSTYILTWNIINSCGLTTDTCIIITTSVKGVSKACTMNDTCVKSGTNSLIIHANTPDNGKGKWIFVSGSNTITFSDSTSANTKVNGLQTGTYSFVWMIYDSYGNTSSDTLNLYIPAGTLVANAGNDITVCDSFTELHGTKSAWAESNWIYSGNFNEPFIYNAESITTKVSNLSTGDYPFVFQVNYGTCTANSDTVIVSVLPQTMLADAGPDLSAENTDSFYMSANDAPAGMGEWKIADPAADDAVIVEKDNPFTLVKNVAFGKTQLLWIIHGTQGCPDSYDSLSIINIEKPSSEIFSQVCEGDTFRQVIPDNNEKDSKWVLVDNNTETVLLSGTGFLKWIAASTGKFKFRYYKKSINGEQSFINIYLNVSKRPVSNAGIDKLVDLSGGNEIILNGSYSSGWNHTWSKKQGPGCLMQNQDSSTLTVKRLEDGIYIFNYAVSNGICRADDQVKITVFKKKNNTEPEDTSEDYIFMPGAFTPNDDGINDWFAPVSEKTVKYTLIIYNRWGEQVYVGTEINKGWNGMVNGKACQLDMYFYSVTFTGNTNAKNINSGTLTGTLYLMR